MGTPYILFIKFTNILSSGAQVLIRVELLSMTAVIK